MREPGAWGGLRRVFRLPASRDRIPAALDDEFRFHIEGRIDDLVAAGMNRAEAEAEARRRFGDYDAYRRQATEIDERLMRDRDRLDMLDGFGRELRLAARALVRTPAFTAIALATLVLGIGATTAIYTILEAVVLRPLPYAEAERLVSIKHPTEVPGTGASKWGMSAGGYFHFRKENRTLSDIGAYTAGWTTVLGDGGGGAERVRTGLVTHPVFSVLGATPAAGRLIGEADDKPGAERVVMLGHDFWQRRYAGDPSVVGRRIQTSRGTFTVVGVTAKGFNLPTPGPWDTGSDLAGFRVDVWYPLQLDPLARAQNSHQYVGVARLRPGRTVEDAQRDLQALTDRFPETMPSAYSPGFMEQYHFRVGVNALQREVVGENVARALWVLFAAVGLVLLIACANVANLFLVRLEARRREAAVRTALGADRRRMAAHYLSESMLLSLAGGTLGVVFAMLAVRGLLSVAPTDLPRLAEVELRWTSIAFAAAISLLVGTLFGVLPLLRRGIDTATLRDGARGMTASKRQKGTRNALVVGQVALALVLLASAGLMVRSLAHLRNVKPGMNPDDALVFALAIPNTRYDSLSKVLAFHRELQERLRALPGVTAVGAGSNVPLRDYGSGCTVVSREGRPFGEGEEQPCVSTPNVVPGFLEALGVTVQGRTPTWADVDANTGAVVVTKALADRLWPGEDPIGKGINSQGQRFRDQPADWYRVVGVIPELRAAGLDKPPTEIVFYPARSLPRAPNWGTLYGAEYVVRTSGVEPTSLVPTIRRAIAELDPGVPVANVTTMQDVVAGSMARVSFIMVLLAAAAGMALLLSAVGIYGVISYVVSQRRSEIGVRVALGARVGEVARMVMMQSLRLAALGVVIGLGAALAGTRVLRSLLFDVSPTDPVVLALVATLLLLIAGIASFAPARRAARTDPAEALRAQ